jgi:integrase
MPTRRSKETGRFINLGTRPHELFIQQHAIVKDWLQNRPPGTREQYGNNLYIFCKDTGITAEEFWNMGRLEARDAAWAYVKPSVGKYNTKAKNFLAALKSFYRNKDGETLPFDSRRGGKHYIPKRRKKASQEYVPSKSEMYQIIDAANNARDRAVLLVLFQSGIRVNALSSLKYKHVKGQLYPETKIPLMLKITDDIDSKLRGYDKAWYYTFLQGEAVEALKTYCSKYHRGDMGDGDKFLFYSKLGNPLGEHAVWEIVKRCVKRAGLPVDGIWTHTIRRAFKHVLRRSILSHDFAEALMGHRLQGSEENYFSRNKPEEWAREYMKANFGRTTPKSRIEIMERELTTKKTEIEALKARLSKIEGSKEGLLQLLLRVEELERKLTKS